MHGEYLKDRSGYRYRSADDGNLCIITVGSTTGEVESSSTNPKSASENTSKEHPAGHVRNMKEDAREKAGFSAFPSTMPTTGETDAEAGPPRAPHNPADFMKAARDQHAAEFGRHSRFPASILPQTRIRGTTAQIGDFFDPMALAEIDNPELFRDLPLLGPPPQPRVEGGIDPEPRPYWNLSVERSKFFSEGLFVEQPRIPENPTVQANLERYHELKKKGVHFNENLMRNRSFKNPHVYSQLVEFLGIDETRSNLPCLDTGRGEAGSWRAVFPLSEQELIEGDPIATLEKQQQDHMDRQMEKLKAGHKRTIDFSRGQYEDADDGPSLRSALSWEEPLRSATSSKTGHRADDRKRTAQSNAGSEAKRRSFPADQHRKSGKNRSKRH
ncbi:uncharacterized protein UTRI_00506_B [Ustilago trichophora]|uniref:HCNGP-domain-containing protein n=1 Tax=Ustilago trichophora TaxID=86804 RepID=A0A5C3DSD6_9BASI|nr:uncharacterized protein UTRI_00506_B [Ustilago trichophora]